MRILAGIALGVTATISVQRCWRRVSVAIFSMGDR